MSDSFSTFTRIVRTFVVRSSKRDGGLINASSQATKARTIELAIVTLPLRTVDTPNRIMANWSGRGKGFCYFKGLRQDANAYRFCTLLPHFLSSHITTSSPYGTSTSGKPSVSLIKL
ncbi:hypothetical protein TNCT_653781 [Trichonephila clavata]|uniref:Uncharacterized protein n=1 Tax=Trichonephila clavata TaxID=2740835 RepID=A0A8X6KDH8_TRICU|nr:hypothetical protein TNCT_653781 [Trichonephila clavata]